MDLAVAVEQVTEEDTCVTITLLHEIGFVAAPDVDAVGGCVGRGVGVPAADAVSEDAVGLGEKQIDFPIKVLSDDGGLLPVEGAGFGRVLVVAVT